MGWAQGQALPVRTLGFGPVLSVAWSRDGKYLAVGSKDAGVHLIATTWQVIGTLSGHTSWVYSVAFSPDGTTLASGSSDTTIKLWDVSDLVGR